ncbi:MAG: molybdenum cofactor biosynthesis protein MoaE [Chloroflexia bacterium]
MTSTTNTNAIHIRLLLFAQFREALDGKQLDLSVPPDATPASVLDDLTADKPRLQALRGVVRFLVNGEFVSSDAELHDGDELAFVPPVAGGAGEHIRISEAPLGVDEFLRHVQHPGAGGLVVFLGVVRDNNEGRDVKYLEYEAHIAAAERSIQQICEQAVARWPDVRLAVGHRIGRLEIGEASVVVAAGAPHRAEAFESARYVIDTLKAETPIWKKEVFEGGEAWIGEDVSPA